ncbi:hypothetical protein [uncultured Polaribacter sp.]|uniref:hypothetical protein n=1 Tax=uncultured Polaribacter sp. TaxID=174711 RepID=UPI00263762FB|nr:hypothetical protein [uncultured Polaribacter sp.]
MSVFESVDSSSEDGVEKGKDFINKSYVYYKLKTFHTLTLSLSILVKLILIGGLLTIGVLFFSIALAITLGDYLNSVPLGYLLVGVVFFFIGFIIFLVRKSIDEQIISKVGSKFLK